MYQGKVWGDTRSILQTPFIEIHEIAIEPNSHCSMHAHAHKWNLFYVLEGQMTIEVEKSDYDLTDKTVLGEGESTTVKPGEYHRFVTQDDYCRALEIYYLSPISEDIIRRDVGGVVETNPQLLQEKASVRVYGGGGSGTAPHESIKIGTEEFDIDENNMVKVRF